MGVVRSQGSGCFEKDREGSDQEHLSCMFTVWTECLCSPKFMFRSVQCLCVKIYVLRRGRSQDGGGIGRVITFSSTNSLKEQQNGEQSLQNNF